MSIFLIRSLLCLFTYPVEVLLVVRGRIKMTLTANILRLGWVALLVVPAYFQFGVIGVVFVYATSEIPAIVYSGWIAYKDNLYNFKMELCYLAVALCAFGTSDLLESLLFKSFSP